MAGTLDRDDGLRVSISVGIKGHAFLKPGTGHGSSTRWPRALTPYSDLQVVLAPIFAILPLIAIPHRAVLLSGGTSQFLF